jgi:hypothetical protein
LKYFFIRIVIEGLLCDILIVSDSAAATRKKGIIRLKESQNSGMQACYLSFLT